MALSSEFRWLDVGGRRIATRIDLPEGVTSRGVIVVAPSIGREFTNSYRLPPIMALQAAREGYIGISFAFSGDGDSSPIGRVDDPVDSWIEELRAVASLAVSMNCGPVTVVAIRVGAAVARSARLPESIRIVLWEPVSGRTFLREQRMLRKFMSHRSTPPDDDVVEGVGFHLGRSQAEHLLRLKAPRPPVPNNMTVRRERDRQVALEIASMSPQSTRVPFDSISELILEALSSEHNFNSDTLLEQLRLSRSWEEAGVRERFCRVGNHELVGVLTTRAKPVVRVVLTATAAESREGPGGIWAAYARNAAGKGGACLRVDRRGTGDALDETSDQAPNPYTREAVEDVAVALRYGDESLPVVGAGICAGGWLMLLAARSARPASIVVVNCVVWGARPGPIMEPGLSSWQGESTAAQTSESTSQDQGGLAFARRWRGVLVQAVARVPRRPWMRMAFVAAMNGGALAPALRRVPRATRVKLLFGRDEFIAFRVIGGTIVVKAMRAAGWEISIHVDDSLEHSVLTRSSEHVVASHMDDSVACLLDREDH